MSTHPRLAAPALHHRILIPALLALLLAGCAAPVGVTRIPPEQSYRIRTENVLDAGQVSDSTRAVLHRYNLIETMAETPELAIEALHALSRNDQRRDLLFALAELSYLAGSKRAAGSSLEDWKKAEDLFLQSALYAYFFLLDNDRGELPGAYERRYRVASDLYNQALWQAFPKNDDGSLILSATTRNLTGGPLPLTLNTDNLINHYDALTGLIPTDNYAVRGFTVRNRTAGLGMPLVGLIRQDSDSPTGGALPLTALLRLTGDYQAYLDGSAAAVVELYSALDTAEVVLNDHRVPLQTDLTTPLAYRLNDARIWRIGERRFLTGAEVPQRVLLIQPYEPGRIPVVFVHGTASSPVWWAEMVNVLRADPQIRTRFQFWFYQYNSSNLVMLSAAELREAITAMVARLDPLERDPALRNIVVVGHSQGGLLAKTTAVSTGTALWQALSSEDLESMNLDRESEDFIRRLLFFEPVPSVRRVVFISTPHRGSFLSKGWIRSLTRSIIAIPASIITQEKLFDTLGARVRLPASVRGEIPTSIDGMSKDNPLLAALAALPLAPGVVGHSIIAVKPGMEITEGNDGVVEYQSAHIDGVASEFIVRTGHSCQGHPFTIEEVRRILLEHLGSGSGPVPPAARGQGAGAPGGRAAAP